ncbi:MAG: polysaccharide export protein [Planctomycetaceae bacterium]|nr:MAG: polysaccharide export protein [Planctomycetaceae bacterium]
MGFLRRVLVVLTGASVAACTPLPVDGPDHRAIKSGAAATLVADRHEVILDYALIDINKTVLELAVNIGPDSFFRTFGSKPGPAPIIRVGVGDVVQVTVFESGSGGLFIPAEAGVRPGNFVTMPPQTVDRSGTISVPFAGEVKAAGQSIPQIQREIVTKLENRAIEPQVVVTLVEQNASEVAVVGDVLNGANKFKIRPNGERILDMISKAGGMRYPGYELFVTLQRNNKRATVYFPSLVNNPAENIYTMPGDAIYVYREQQKFVAVGAIGTGGATGQIAFEQERLSLNEAVAKAGGLLDLRADPAQVFVYRMEDREALAAMKVNLQRFPREQRFIPTIYRANFRDPSSFFFAQRFPMRHKDIIYAANADSVEVVKFMNYLRSITATVAGTTTDAAITREIIKGGRVLGQ